MAGSPFHASLWNKAAQERAEEIGKGVAPYTQLTSKTRRGQGMVQESRKTTSEGLTSLVPLPAKISKTWMPGRLDTPSLPSCTQYHVELPRPGGSDNFTFNSAEMCQQFTP